MLPLKRKHAFNIPAAAQRGCGLQQQHLAHVGQLLEGMEYRRNPRCVVGGQLRRTQKGHFCTPLLGDLSNGWIVGTHNNPFQRRDGQGRLNGVGDQRFIGQ